MQAAIAAKVEAEKTADAAAKVAAVARATAESNPADAGLGALAAAAESEAAAASSAAQEAEKKALEAVANPSGASSPPFADVLSDILGEPPVVPNGSALNASGPLSDRLRAAGSTAALDSNA